MGRKGTFLRTKYSWPKSLQFLTGLRSYDQFSVITGNYCLSNNNNNNKHREKAREVTSNCGCSSYLGEKFVLCGKNSEYRSTAVTVLEVTPLSIEVRLQRVLISYVNSNPLASATLKTILNRISETSNQFDGHMD